MNGPNLVHYFFAALICFLLAFFRKWEQPTGSVSIGWMGMFFWMLDILIFSSSAVKG